MGHFHILLCFWFENENNPSHHIPLWHLGVAPDFISKFFCLFNDNGLSHPNKTNKSPTIKKYSFHREQNTPYCKTSPIFDGGMLGHLQLYR